MNEFQFRFNQPLLKRIIDLLPKDVPIYLVGGAVRDIFLNRPSYDLDFVTGGNSMRMARKLADELGAAYFPLDSQRKVARLVLKTNMEISRIGTNPIRVDISAYQGADLGADLLGRDFTINAMAVEVHRLEKLVDPLGGAADLAARRLRACSPRTFLDDPVRILRAVRLSVDLELNILPATLHFMREACHHLPDVSAERLRDELFRMLALLHPTAALRILDSLDALDYLLPEIGSLKNVQQSEPHVLDAWNHTFDVLSRLENLLEVLGLNYDPNKAENLIMGMVVMRLGRYRQQLADHLSFALNPERPHRGLLFMAALYHDVGKLSTQSVDGEGKTRFIGHEQIGSQLVYKRGQALKLSNLEIDYLVTIVSHHMRPSLLSHSDVKPSRKSIYRFFRDTGAAGVDICLLSLADLWATYGPAVAQDRWSNHLDVVQTMLGAWWDEKKELVFPPAIIDGKELMEAVHMESGPMVGYLLEAIREAQVNHEVSDKDEAINLAKKILLENINHKTG